MENRSTIFHKINLFIGFIGSLCSIVSIGIPIYSYLSEINITSSIMKFIINNAAYFSFFCCIMFLIINHCIILKYKIYTLDIPREEARPSYILSTILVITIVFNLIYILIPPEPNYAKDTQDPDPQNPISEKEEGIPNTSYTDSIDDIEESPLTPLEQTVEEWILISYQETVSVNIWRTLSDEELYYIRNGIFAYSHAKFDQNFYDVYSWYEGTTYISDFDWSVFNYYQVDNILSV